MYEYKLRIITLNQNHDSKAEKLCEKILGAIENSEKISIEKYHKFQNSYSIEIAIKISKNENLFEQCLKISNKICSPWITTLIDNEKNIDLIFNKTESSKYTSENFNTVNWAELTRNE